jgi:prepilin-type N-terminal cleavage/methylation domain-containing protein
MKRKQNKGFTLAELLIVVAIIGVLVAISIPIFTSQLEKAREATDAANIRSQYAEVMSEAITEGGNVSGKDQFGAVELKQKKDQWQSSGLKENLEGVYGQVVGDYPKAGGTAWVEYDGEKAILHYEGGSSGSGNAGGGSTGGPNTNTDPQYAYDNVNGKSYEWPAEAKTVDLETGEVISYDGRLYISSTTRTWEMNQWWYTTPDKQSGDFYVINNKPAQTDADLKKPWQGSDATALVNLSIGDLYQDLDNNYYVYRGGSSTNTPPSRNSNDWIRVLMNNGRTEW